MKALLGCFVAGALAAGVARADVQRWPFSFDVSLAADAGATEALIDAGLGILPPLPVDEMQTMQLENHTMTLWFWPENLALLQGIGDAGTTPMTWPTTPVMCAQHAAFTLPALLLPDAGAACAAAEASIQQQLSDLSACILVEQPERYVLSYPVASPTGAEQGTSSLEGMIGVAGQALLQVGPPPEGVLPPEFVPTLRVVIDKLRHDTLATGLQTASAAYAQATSLVNANASCFDPTASATLLTELSGLTTEIGDVSTYLEQLMTTGEAASAQENVCLAAKSQVRNALPFPALTAADRQFIAFWVGGMYWRMRGGGLIPLGSTQDARYYFVEEAFSRIGEVLGASDGDTAALQLWIAVFEGWSQWMTMGATPGSAGDKYYDLVGMSGRGQREVQGAATALGPKGYDTVDLIAGGLQMGPGYYFGWWGQPGFTYANPLSAPYSGFMDGQTAIGEFNAGAAIGVGMAKSLLNGKATGQPPTVTLCMGRNCGDDGCGGSCGSCAAGVACSDAGVCEGSVAPPDAGVGSDAGAGVDAGSLADAGSSPSPDGGVASAPDAGHPGGSGQAGCGCGASDGASLAELGLAALAWAAARRRRGLCSA